VPRFEDTLRLQRVVWTLSFCLLFAICGNAQQNPNSNRPSNTSPQSVQSAPPLRTDIPINEPNEAQDRQARDLEKKANLERQAALKADTEKLLKLATELKQSVDKTNASVLSLDVVKKAEEIERLAHSVKDKMKGPG
jgi:hypothetical protein